jgi:hypothetical protein
VVSIVLAAHFVIAAWQELTAHDRDLVEHRKAC